MRTILITGSTDGIGRQTAKSLAEMGYRVIIHGRNPEKTERVKEELITKTSNELIDTVVADFSILDQVKKMAERIKHRYSVLDVLINNAGVYMPNRVLNPDGYELTLTVNHLAHFLLTNLIISLLEKSKDGRIINVSSMIHADSIDFDNLNGDKYYSGSYAYSLSKLCNVLFTYKLTRLLSNTNITVNCLHPGVINTKLLRAGWGGGEASVVEGARTSVFLATSDEVKGISGKYFVNMKEAKSKPVSYNHDIQDRCWEKSMEMVSKYME